MSIKYAIDKIKSDYPVPSPSVQEEFGRNSKSPDERFQKLS